FCFFFSSRRRHTRFSRDWSSDVCSSDLCVFYTKAKDGIFSDIAKYFQKNLSDFCQKIPPAPAARSVPVHWMVRVVQEASWLMKWGMMPGFIRMVKMIPVSAP